MRHIIGTISFLGYVLNTLFWSIPIIFFSFFKLIPIKPWQTFMSYFLDNCATAWVSLNNLNQRLTSRTTWDIKGIDSLSMNDWYLIIANHRSWVDIVVLQRIFNRKIPFLKFFLKKELIWVPVLGLAWWALDFPFMQRYKKSFLAKNPHLKGKDLETTRKACEKFRFKPVSIMNFVEGTRYTEDKYARQASPFKHLLKPKAGGIAFVLDAMQTHLHTLVDVTIYYPGGTPSFWDFVSGKVKQVQVRVKVQSIDELRQSGVIGDDYFNNKDERVIFQRWLNQVWYSKDDEITQLIEAAKK
ncbi:acyltransferase [Alteromonas sp. a30]|uniref:acyltransferase n=1 Tax=Alteromonas sp. a30 TaxID=2730917 RepID=UPI002282B784|nr:acyltransferase [Alteromonas sp. a30]MCY7294852.1 acyltransferase [Alteromonas sp. a30]